MELCVEKAIKVLLVKRLQTNYDNKYRNKLNHPPKKHDRILIIEL